MMSSEIFLLGWLLEATFREPTAGHYWAPPSQGLNPSTPADFIDGFPDGITEVKPNTKGFVTFKYTDPDTGKEFAKTNFFKYVPINWSSSNWFVQQIKNIRDNLLPDIGEIGGWWDRIAMPVNLYSEMVPIEDYGKTPSQAALELAFDGNRVEFDDFMGGVNKPSGKKSKTNWQPLLFSGLGFAAGGPIGALVGFGIGTILGNKKTLPKPSPADSGPNPFNIGKI